MKKTILRIVSFALLLAVMVAIFMFSAETSTESDATSGKVIIAIAKILRPDFEKLEPAAQEKFVGDLQSITRTLAHFLIFAALGFFAANSLLTFKIGNGKRFLISFVFSFLYALSDEIHQYFVPGRAFQFSDLCVDTLGAGLGIGVLLILFFICKKIYKKKRPKKFAAE